MASRVVALVERPASEARQSPEPDSNTSYSGTFSNRSTADRRVELELQGRWLERARLSLAVVRAWPSGSLELIGVPAYGRR